MTQQCQECSRRDSEIQRLRSEASTLRQAKLQDEEPLLDGLVRFEAQQPLGWVISTSSPIGTTRRSGAPEIL
jgi:hypothetical protein